MPTNGADGQTTGSRWTQATQRPARWMQQRLPEPATKSAAARSLPALGDDGATPVLADDAIPAVWLLELGSAVRLLTAAAADADEADDAEAEVEDDAHRQRQRGR